MLITRIGVGAPVAPTLFALLVLLLTPAGVSADAVFERLFIERNHKEALAYADSGIPIDTRTPSIWLKIGQCNEALGFTERALACYKEVWRTRPDAEAAFRIGRAYAEAGVPDSAVPYLQIAIDRRMSVSEASRHIARARFGQKRYEDAVAGFRGVAGNRMTAMDHYMLGFSLAAVGDSAGAFGAYRAAAGAFGDEKRREALESRAFVARAHLKNGEAPAALPHLQFIVAADERSAVIRDIYLLLTDAYIEMGDDAEAILTLERAIAANQRTPAIFARLAEVLEKNGQDVRAESVREAMRRAAGEK